MDYAEQVQISANNLTWAEQVNNETVEHSSSNKVPSVENTHISYVEDTMNVTT